MMGICGYFSYVYWLKDLKRASYGFAIIAGFCFLALVYYVWTGSPDRAAGAFDNMIQTIRD